jgi:hypothetical protein
MKRFVKRIGAIVTSSKRRMQASSIELKEIKKRIWANGAIQLREAIEDGYWIEAVAIEESMMADAIESWLQNHYKLDKLMTLREGVNAVLRLGPNSSDEEVFLKVKSWINDRDIVINELMKVNKKIQLSWDQKMNFNLAVAIEGRDLAKEIKNWSRRKPNLKN